MKVNNMDNRFDKIDSKLDDVSHAIHNIDKTLVRQEEQLAYHIKRTNLLEEKMQPVESHVAAVNVVLKLVGFLAVLISITTAIAKFL
jgi:uncharacterized coiled-coil protein SlyX